MTVDWGEVRQAFPALENWTYLNSATFGQLPRPATEAVVRHLARRDREASGDFLEWFDDADAIRAPVAQLVSAEPEDIAFINNAASGLSVLMIGQEWAAGDRIVTLAGEFPNNLYNPAVLAERGVECVQTTWDELPGTITPRTRMVILSAVNYVTGFCPPLEELSRFLRERGVLLCVDGTQSVGALRFDCRSIQPAALIVDAYKWLLGPTGSGFMYVRPDVRQRLKPSVIGWRSHKSWRDVDNLHHGAPEFVASAEKYEGGMLTFPSLYGMAASVEMMLGIGVDAIENRVLDFAERARQILRDAGAGLLADERPHHVSPVIAGRFPGRDAPELARALYGHRIVVSARHGYLRVSTHFYNDDSDLERLRLVLADVL
jgi:selenocysteine lyase/cysteine desulfurase